MTFAWPWFLALAPLPLIIVLWRRRKRPTLSVSSLKLWEHTESGRARFLWLPPVMKSLGMACLFIALARPQAGTDHAAQISQGIAIQMLIDVSSSMSMDIRMPDGQGRSRMEVAKELVEKFVSGDEEELDGRDGDLIGLITFARYADTRSPLTLGHNALLSVVRDLTIQERPNEDGTAYGDALAVAAARLKQLDDPEVRKMRSLEGDIASRIIILLTDGENNSGSHLPVEAAGLAKEWGCRIYAISLGDRPRSSAGAATSALSEAERVLEHISLETGGVFRTASDYDSLLAVYREIDELEQARIVSRTYTRVSEQFGIPLAAAALLLTLSFLGEATWLRTIP
ncbi:MAG: VWA domain-containing protein [Verrucomicrobiota bacterium]